MPLSSGPFLAIAGPLRQDSVPIRGNGRADARRFPTKGNVADFRAGLGRRNPQATLIQSATSSVNDATTAICIVNGIKAA
jgi:hypothetical protein